MSRKKWLELPWQCKRWHASLKQSIFTKKHINKSLPVDCVITSIFRCLPGLKSGRARHKKCQVKFYMYTLHLKAFQRMCLRYLMAFLSSNRRSVGQGACSLYGHNIGGGGEWGGGEAGRVDGEEDLRVRGLCGRTFTFKATGKLAIKKEILD